MIDFRYHLVSIISIFLALAVGIVLGAGPLQSNLGNQLTDQVSALRTDKQDLNDKLDASEKMVTAEQDYAEAVSSRVVAGRLPTHQVVLVALPSADGGLVKQLQTTLAASGATVTATVALSADWADPTKAAARATAATAAATALGVTSTDQGDALLQEVLAQVVVSRDSAGPTPERTAALAVLSDAGLLDSTEAQIDPGDLAVVVSGHYSGEEAAVAAVSDEVRALATALLDHSATTVVAGVEPVVAAGQPVTSDGVSAVRSDRTTATSISTVDHALGGSGPARVVLAIEAQLTGDIGHYGISEGATAAVPRVAP
ncbi:MAG: copper transporter [Terracoccus sp.]